jgi:hypothetical protein
VSKIGEGCFGQVWKYEATEGVPGYNKVNVPMSKCSKKINSLSLANLEISLENKFLNLLIY